VQATTTTNARLTGRCSFDMAVRYLPEGIVIRYHLREIRDYRRSTYRALDRAGSPNRSGVPQ
jgi:hypothetical protein